MAAPPMCGQPVVRVVCQPVVSQNTRYGGQSQKPRISLPLNSPTHRHSTPVPNEVRQLTPSSQVRQLTPSSESLVRQLTPSSEKRAALSASPSAVKIPSIVMGAAAGLRAGAPVSPCFRPVVGQPPQSPRIAAVASGFPGRSPSHRRLPGEISGDSSCANSASGSPCLRPAIFCASPRAPAEVTSPSAQVQVRTLGSCIKQQDDEATTARVVDLLAHRESLKAEVVRCFKRIAGSGTNINIRGLQNFKTLLAQAIGVPLEALGNLQTEYIRFDFDGDGRLHFNEAYKLVKHHLWIYLKKHGGVSQVGVPYKSLDEAGFRVTKELGRGSQGVAMLATDSQGQEWCVKCYDKGKMSCGGLSELKDEFETMQRLSCDMIAHACEIFQDQQFYYSIGEAYYGGDLTTLKQRAEKEGVDMTEQWWRSIFRQCFQALAFMHENAMMHCDIKEPNIMVKRNDFHTPEIVLIDFGVSKAMAEDDNGKVYGTPGYIPPETFEMKMWFPGGDVFSMGVCVLQVVGNQVPSTSSTRWNTRGVFIEGCGNLREVMQATLAREPPFHLLPKNMPGLETVVRSMLQKQMALRPRAPQVLQDPWFTADLDSSELGMMETSFPEHILGTIGISDDLYRAF